MADRRTVPVMWCLIAAALFGASTPAAKVFLASVGPLALAGLLYLGAAIAVLPVSFKGGSSRLARKPRNLMMLAVAVVFGQHAQRISLAPHVTGQHVLDAKQRTDIP